MFGISPQKILEQNHLTQHSQLSRNLPVLRWLSIGRATEHSRTCLAARPDHARNAQARSSEAAGLKEDEKEPCLGAEPGRCL